MKRLFRVYSRTRKTYKNLLLSNSEVINKVNDGYFAILADDDVDNDRFKIDRKQIITTVTKWYDPYDYTSNLVVTPKMNNWESIRKSHAL